MCQNSSLQAVSKTQILQLKWPQTCAHIYELDTVMLNCIKLYWLNMMVDLSALANTTLEQFQVTSVQTLPIQWVWILSRLLTGSLRKTQRQIQKAGSWNIKHQITFSLTNHFKLLLIDWIYCWRMCWLDVSTSQASSTFLLVLEFPCCLRAQSSSCDDFGVCLFSSPLVLPAGTTCL